MKEYRKSVGGFVQVIAFIFFILISFYKCALRALLEELFAIACSRTVESCSAGAHMPISGPI